jgi:hypothetical protein
MWHDAGKVYFVHEMSTRPGTTAVKLTLEDNDGNVETRTVASHQIEWVSE